MAQQYLNNQRETASSNRVENYRCERSCLENDTEQRRRVFLCFIRSVYYRYRTILKVATKFHIELPPLQLCFRLLVPLAFSESLALFYSRKLIQDSVLYVVCFATSTEYQNRFLSLVLQRRRIKGVVIEQGGKWERNDWKCAFLTSNVLKSIIENTHRTRVRNVHHWGRNAGKSNRE